jgi:hypothetical protein
MVQYTTLTNSKFGTEFVRIFSRFTTTVITSSSDGEWILVISYLSRTQRWPHTTHNSTFPVRWQTAREHDFKFYTLEQHDRRNVTIALLLPSTYMGNKFKFCKMAATSAENAIGKNVRCDTISL